MANDNSVIETGVDKLVKLVKERGKIAFADAAKELGVSSTVIQEWVEFLEEEGIINTEYKLTRPFIVDKKMTKKEVEVKAKEFEGKKDVFVRKAEANLTSLEKQASDLKKIKQEFDDLKSDLGLELESVKSELQQLEKYEQLKRELQADIEGQKNNSKLKIDDLTKQIEREQKKYQELLSSIERGRLELSKEKKDAKSIEEAEKILNAKLADFKNTIALIEKKVTSEDAAIRSSELQIDKLADLMDEIKKHVAEEKSTIDVLVEKSKGHEEKIRKMQEEIIKKVSSRHNGIKNAGEITRKVNTFFAKKLAVLNLIEKVNKDRDDLEKNLVDLIRKAKSFELSSKSGNVNEQMVELEKKFTEVDKKKEVFEKELKDLASSFRK